MIFLCNKRIYIFFWIIMNAMLFQCHAMPCHYMQCSKRSKRFLMKKAKACASHNPWGLIYPIVTPHYQQWGAGNTSNLSPKSNPQPFWPATPPPPPSRITENGGKSFSALNTTKKKPLAASVMGEHILLRQTNKIMIFVPKINSL